MSKQVTETEQMRLILRIVCIRHELTKLIISDIPMIDANYNVIYKVGGDEGKEREAGSLEGGDDGQRRGEERAVLAGLEMKC